MYACVNRWFEWTMCLSGLFSGLNAIYMTVWMDCLIWLYACLYELYICLDGLCACLDGLHLSRQTVFLSEWILLNQIVYFALVVTIYEMGGHTSLFLFLLIRLAYDYDSMRLSYLHYSGLWLFITFYSECDMSFCQFIDSILKLMFILLMLWHILCWWGVIIKG